MTPENTTQPQGIACLMPKPRKIRMSPETTSETPSRSVKNTAASSGFSNVTNPAMM